MRKPVIAIDGYSSTGKSSISKIIAARLGLVHMDTGALSRGITYFAIKNCLNKSGEIDLQSLFSKLKEINLEFTEVESELVLLLNSKDISKETADAGNNGCKQIIRYQLFCVRIRFINHNREDN